MRSIAVTFVDSAHSVRALLRQSPKP